VNNPTHWTNFAVALAGVAAVLAGLVFVALSLNLERILQVAGLPGRAGETLIVLWAVIAGSGNAWVLVVEIVRDARYLPLDDPKGQP
jgi:hypothetical protein